MLETKQKTSIKEEIVMKIIKYSEVQVVHKTCQKQERKKYLLKYLYYKNLM